MLGSAWLPGLRAAAARQRPHSSWRGGHRQLQQRLPLGKNAGQRPLHAAAAVHGRRRTGGPRRTVAKDDAGDAELISRLQKALPDLSVTLGEEGACPGCGVALQSHSPPGWGYVPSERADGAGRHAEDEAADGASSSLAGGSGGGGDSAVLCQRCHRLRHHNDSEVRQMTPKQARLQLDAALGHRRCIV